ERRPEARAARLPVERAGDSVVPALRLRARGLQEGPLPPRRRGRLRDLDGVLRRLDPTPTVPPRAGRTRPRVAHRYRGLSARRARAGRRPTTARVPPAPRRSRG